MTVRESGRVTIHTVAKVAGVSSATVSRVLNQSDLVASATRERVLQALEACGFRQPSRLARALRTNRTGILGLLVENVANPYFATVARSVDDAAQQAGLAVVLANDDGSAPGGVERLELFETLNVDGVILAPWAGDDRRRQVARRLASRGAAIVVVGDYLDEKEFDLVGVDLRRAAVEVVQCLIERGHRRIGYVGPAATTDRFAGYQEAVRDAGLPTFALFLPGAPTTANLASLMEQELPGFISGQRLTAVVAHSDFYSFEILRVATARGIKIPGELSVIGFDNTRVAELTAPPLASVEIPKVEMGQMAVELIRQRLDGKVTGGPVRHILPTRVILRESVAGAPPT
ncbi:MAG: LacI family DNA-binding transcriptional regulator [Limnochordales bacterium]|nr:LacI family DNA-binding transcriptional regulator [Limnochordales bacterium]